MQMAIDKDKSLINKVELNLNRTFISHHAFEPSCEKIKTDVADQWT